MNNEILKKAKPFIIVFVSYVIALLLIFCFIDSIIMPSITSSKTVIVPNIEGKSLKEAQQILASKNLTLEVTQEVYSLKQRTGTILSQKPIANTNVKEGRTILVNISKGKKLVRVPYIQLLSIREAELLLSENDLEIGVINYEFSENIDKDIIISQSLRAGEHVLYGTAINIVISKGPETQIQIPNLIGKSILEAKEILEETGLLLGIINYKVNETYQPDIVLEQTPLPGEAVIPNTTINIVVSK